jgi:carbamate kinase
MAPKIDAAVAFAKAGGRSYIGPLDRLPDILARKVGTEVRADFAEGIEYYPSK